MALSFLLFVDGQGFHVKLGLTQHPNNAEPHVMMSWERGILRMTSV